MERTTGRLFFRQGRTLGRTALLGLYRTLNRAYPEERLWVVQDNAPVHMHKDVMAALRPQLWPRVASGFTYTVPSNWDDPTEAARSKGDLPVQVILLPTYASWLNPIERLWRWLRQEILHMHPFEGNAEDLGEAVAAFLKQFADGSGDLLRYVGLSGA